MNCNDTIPLLDMLLDGALEAKDCALVVDHLKKCSSCDSQWAELERMRARFQDAKERLASPHDLTGRISTALETEERALRKRQDLRFLHPIRIKTIAASLLIVGMIALPIYRNVSQAPELASSVSIEKLIDDLDTKMADKPVKNKEELVQKLGYDLHFLPLKPWHMTRLSLRESASKQKLARFDFAVKLPDAVNEQHLTCFQAKSNSIARNGCSEKLIGDKRVYYGTQRNYHFALWSQNDRDYLLVTALPSKKLEAIIQKV